MRDKVVSREVLPKELLDRLEGKDGYAHWMTLARPTRRAYELIGLYAQRTAAIDLHLRRIYFALRAEGDNERGPERAHLMQLIDRLPAAVAKCEAELAQKEGFLEILEKLGAYVTQRNKVAHAVCRWHMQDDLLVFAHANETTGDDIKTGEGIAFFIIPLADFVANVRQLELIDGHLQRFTELWLPKLRPWLTTTLVGPPDKRGRHQGVVRVAEGTRKNDPPADA